MYELKECLDKKEQDQDVSKIVANIIANQFADRTKPVLIAVGGPGGTGKSTFCSGLCGILSDSVVFRVDDYKTPRVERREKGLFGPHPEANEMDLLEGHLADVSNNVIVNKPVYNASTGCADTAEKFVSAKFNILDGEISTYERFRSVVDFSIFIDADLRTQLVTRLTRDITHRSYTKEKALATFHGSNRREFGNYGSSSKEWADIVLFCGKDYSLEIRKMPIFVIPAKAGI